MSHIDFGNPDRPNSYIGRSVPRPQAARLVQGRGRFIDDIVLPRMLHVAFLRSPYAHAEIGPIDTAAAEALPGVRRVVTGAELAQHVTPWVGTLAHLTGMKSPPQHPLAIDRVRWTGEPLVAVVADSRAAAEEGVAALEVDFTPLPVISDMRAALDPVLGLLHEEYTDNLAFERRIDTGDVDSAFANAAAIVGARFKTARHTGVCLEGRAILADFDRGSRQLTVWHATQAPHMIHTVLATHLGLPESQVRVVCQDIGGSFGIKVHVYPDEIATAALSRLMNRPVKFVADRIESFASDIHARDHEIDARMAVDANGRILAIDMDDITGIGPFSVYPRTSAVECNQVLNLVGGPYQFEAYRARGRAVFQNKVPTSQYRAVGHPIATAVTEGLVDMAAAAVGLDPAEMRRRNLIADDAYPTKSPAGMHFEALSHHASLAKLLELMDYDALRVDQEEARARGVYRGIGLASFIELTNPSPMMYGIGGARISAQDGCTVRMDPDGSVVAHASVTEQGQGTEAVLAQIVAEAVGVSVGEVRVVTGDTQNTPYGGGTWASRGAGIGGEAALQAGLALRDAILHVAGAILQSSAENLDIRNGSIVDHDGGAERMTLGDLGRVVYFRGDTLPVDLARELVQTRHYITKKYPFAFTNGVQASHVELDPDTGVVRLLKHWCVEDCGRVINPMLVDEQIRGGIVQGLGGALFEECHYDTEGQILNASMADYLVPMAAEMPDMVIGHVETPTAESALGAKGAGEAGTAGAPAAVMNAINDALSPFDARITEMPLTPERVLRALGRLPA